MSKKNSLVYDASFKIMRRQWNNSAMQIQ